MNSNYFNISKLYRAPENSMSSSHTHSFWELFYLTKGSCSILIRDALYEINEGTIFLIPCDISHKTIYSNTDNERIVIELGDDYVAPIISGFPDLTFYNKYCCHFFTFNLSASNLINYYFDTVLLTQFYIFINYKAFNSGNYSVYNPFWFWYNSVIKCQELITNREYNYSECHWLHRAELFRQYFFDRFGWTFTSEPFLSVQAF